MTDPRKIPLTAEERQAIAQAQMNKRVAKIEKMGGPVGGVTLPDHASNHAVGGTDELTPLAIGALAASDPRVPTTDQKSAMAGTSGTPSASNKYVTNNDSRMSSIADLSRKTLTQTITVAAGAEASINLDLYTAFAIWSVETNKAARLRIYATTADRTTDTSRAEGVAPTAGIGLITEVITTASLLVVPMTPPQIGASLATIPGTSIPALIKNKSASADLVLTIKFTRLEI